MLEDHSICREFRTTKYYLYFSFLQLALALVLLLALLRWGSMSVVPLELAIGTLLAADV